MCFLPTVTYTAIRFDAILSRLFFLFWRCLCTNTMAIATRMPIITKPKPAIVNLSVVKILFLGFFDEVNIATVVAIDKDCERHPGLDKNCPPWSFTAVVLGCTGE